MAPTIDWDASYGTWRAIIEGCLLFADPAQRIKTPHPSEAPSTPDAPDGPDEWIQNVECTFTAVSIDPEGEGIYYMFDWGDGSYSDWLGPYPSGETIDKTNIWPYLGDYDVRVKARDIWGVSSDWSAAHTISIVENEPPAKVTINGPSTAKGGEELEFTFVSTDPDGHDIYYKVDWDDGTNTGWLGLYSSGEQITLTHSWNTKGEYWVKAWAKDTLEGKSQQASFHLDVLKNKNLHAVQSSQLLNILLAQKLLIS